jgi:uncharacterized protein YllA (UPF0747 family)
MKLRDLPGLTEFYVDWVEGVPGARALLSFQSDRAALQEQAADARIRFTPRAEIHRLLESQAGELNAGELACNNIQRLLLPESVVVLSSLPAVLAGGPLALLLKCLTTVKLAAELDNAGIPAIPLCWLDHDPKGATFPASVGLLDQEAQLRRFLLQPSAGADGAEGGGRPIPEKIGDFVAALESSLGIDLKDAAIQELIKTFTPGTPFSRASARFMSAWIAGWGIVLLDPRSPDFRATAMRSLKHFGFSQERAAFLCCRQEEELRRSGYCRPAADLARGHEKEPDKTEAPQFDVAPGPLIQLFLEAVLPVAAHVIDPEEIRDFALAAPLFKELRIRSPLLWPRASATLLDARSRKNMEKYGITFESLLAGKSEVLRNLTRQEPVQRVISRLDALSESIEKGLAEIKTSAGARSDVDLLLSDTRSRTLYQLGKLKERFSAATNTRREVIGRQVERVFNSLLPDGGLQEMVVAGLHFALRNSSGFLPMLYERLDIQSFEHQLISME